MRRLIIKKIVLGDTSMKIEIPTMNGFIPDCYSKFANADQKIEGKPSRSFQIFIPEAPDNAKTLSV